MLLRDNRNALKTHGRGGREKTERSVQREKEYLSALHGFVAQLKIAQEKVTGLYTRRSSHDG